MTPLRPTVFRLFSWVVVASLARQLVFLVVNIVLFERLSRSVYGAIALGFAYRAVFAGLGEFGIRQTGWRDIARHRDRAGELTPALLGAKSATTMAAVALYLGLMPLLWEPQLPLAIILFFGLAIAFNGGTFDFPLLGLSRMDLVARYSLVAYGAYLVGCLMLVHDDTTAWRVPAFFVASMGLLISLEIRWFQANHGPIHLRFRHLEMRRIFRQSWPIGAADTLHRLAVAYPVILLGLTAGSNSVGNYRLGELGFAFLAHFGHLFATASFSHVSEVFQHRRSELSPALTRLAGWVMAGALLAGSGLFHFGPRLLTLAFTENAVQETLRVVQVLAGALILAVPARFLTALLAAINRQQVMLVANSIAVVLGIGGGWVASSTYGIVGMAWAVLATEAIRTGFLVIVYWQELRKSPSDRPVD